VGWRRSDGDVCFLRGIGCGDGLFEYCYLPIYLPTYLPINPSRTIRLIGIYHIPIFPQLFFYSIHLIFTWIGHQDQSHGTQALIVGSTDM
jgi:hypothetical protein